MLVLVYIISGLLIFTKFLDVVSTLRRITPWNPELNPLARWLMSKVGVRPAVWLVFLLAVVIIGIATWLAYDIGLLFQVFYIVGGIQVSFIQAAVAHSNWTQKPNWITIKVNTWFMLMSRFLTKLPKSKHRI